MFHHEAKHQVGAVVGVVLWRALTSDRQPGEPRIRGW